MSLVKCSLFSLLVPFKRHKLLMGKRIYCWLFQQVLIWRTEEVQCRLVWEIFVPPSFYLKRCCVLRQLFIVWTQRQARPVTFSMESHDKLVQFVPHGGAARESNWSQRVHGGCRKLTGNLTGQGYEYCAANWWRTSHFGTEEQSCYDRYREGTVVVC